MKYVDKKKTNMKYSHTPKILLLYKLLIYKKIIFISIKIFINSIHNFYI